MSIPLTGAGGLFTRIGLNGGLLNSVNAYRGTTVPTAIDDTQAQFQSTDQNLVDGLYGQLSSLQNTMNLMPTYLQQLAGSTLIQMSNDSEYMPSNSVQNALQVLIDQMNDTAQSVSACVVGWSSSAGSGNNGNPQIVVSVTGTDGLVQENAFAEVVAGTCTTDAQSGGATLGRETTTFKGQQTAPNSLSWLYPIGSGATIGVTSVNALYSQQGGNGNWLNNSDFETWTVANIPDGWHIAVGTAGTTVLESTAQHYAGSASLEFVGNGSELTAVYQEFGTDTTVRITPLTQLGWCLWAKVDVAPAAGVLEISLVDGSLTVINDEQGNPNLVTADLTTIGTTFAPVSGYFRTPRVLPTATRVRIRLSTALSSGSNVFIDHFGLTQPYVFYQGGPSIAMFSGNQQLIQGDTFTINISNDYAGQFQRLFDKFFNMKALGLLLPSSGSPTISDSLITT